MVGYSCHCIERVVCRKSVVMRFVIHACLEKAGLWRDVKFNPVPIEEYFHIIDEIGRFMLL